MLPDEYDVLNEYGIYAKVLFLPLATRDQSCAISNFLAFCAIIPAPMPGRSTLILNGTLIVGTVRPLVVVFPTESVMDPVTAYDVVPFVEVK